MTGQQPAVPRGEPGSAAGEAAQVSARNSSASLRRALTILNYLGDDSAPVDGAALGTIAAALGMNKSTVLRLVSPLCDFGLVQQDESRRYRLGPQTAYLGRAYEERLRVPTVAHPVLHQLMTATGETIHLAVVNGPWVIYIDKVEAVQPVRMASRIGSRQPAYSTGCGKAYLAYDDAALNETTRAGLAARTAQTLSTPAALRADLEVTRGRGYSIDDVENEEDIRCVGAAIFDYRGTVAAALSVSGLSSRVTRARVPELGLLAMQAADEVSTRLGAPRHCLLEVTSRAAPPGPARKEVSRLWTSRRRPRRWPGSPTRAS